MKRLNSKKPSASTPTDDDVIKAPLPSNFHPVRSYSEVVAFGFEDRTVVTSKITPSKVPSRKGQADCPARSFEAFPPLSDFDDGNDVVLLNDSTSSEASEPTTYGNYLETRFENSGSEENRENILNIEIDSFNFTEVDCDPDSSSFPRFSGVFEDKEYLRLEKEVLKNCFFDRST